MPRFDGTGPSGMGPMTGRGQGSCNPSQAAYGPATTSGPGYPGAGYGRNSGGGRGMGRGRGSGRGRGRALGRRGNSPARGIR